MHKKTRLVPKVTIKRRDCIKDMMHNSYGVFLLNNLTVCFCNVFNFRDIECHNQEIFLTFRRSLLNLEKPLLFRASMLQNLFRWAFTLIFLCGYSIVIDFWLPEEGGIKTNSKVCVEWFCNYAKKFAYCITYVKGKTIVLNVKFLFFLLRIVYPT